VAVIRYGGCLERSVLSLDEVVAVRGPDDRGVKPDQQ
jgi:hypothetical protein